MIVDHDTYAILRLLAAFLSEKLTDDELERALLVVNTLMQRASAPTEPRVLH